MNKQESNGTSKTWRKHKVTQEELTQSVLQFIEDYIEEHRYSPSIREIGDQCLIGRTTVTRYLDRLEIQGHITRDLGVARSITLLNSKN